MFSRTHSTALSFILSMMFSASFLGTAPTGAINAGAGGQIMPAVFQQVAAIAQAAGLPVPTNASNHPIAAPAAVAVDFASTKSKFNGMTDAEENKFDLYFQKYKANNSFDTSVSQLLGLTKPGEVITVQQFKGNDRGDTMRTHLFARELSSPDIQFFMFRDLSKPIFYGYLVDSHFNLIQAYVSTGVPQKLEIAEGRTGLAAELAWWAKMMDAAPTPTVTTASN